MSPNLTEYKFAARIGTVTIGEGLLPDGACTCPRGRRCPAPGSHRSAVRDESHFQERAAQFAAAAIEFEIEALADTTTSNGADSTGDPWCGLPAPDFDASELTPLRSLVEGLELPAGYMIALVAKPGAAKTPTALQLGLCLANGLPFAGRPTTRCQVVYLNWEKPLPTRRKRVRIARALGVDPNSLFLLNMTALLLSDTPAGAQWGVPSAADRIAAVVRRMQQHRPEPVVVIVDVYSAAVAGLKEGSSEYADPLFALRKATADLGALCLPLMHAKKGRADNEAPTRDDTYGSGQLVARVDGAISLHKPNHPDDETLIRVCCLRPIEDGFGDLIEGFRHRIPGRVPVSLGWRPHVATPPTDAQ